LFGLYSEGAQALPDDYTEGGETYFPFFLRDFRSIQ